MYLPPQFEETNGDEIAKLIEQFPLATIVCYCDGEFIANHIPLLRVKQNLFVGHVEAKGRMKTILAIWISCAVYLINKDYAA